MYIFSSKRQRCPHQVSFSDHTTHYNNFRTLANWLSARRSLCTVSNIKQWENHQKVI